MDRQRELVIGRFDDHLVRAHAVHAVEHALAFAVETAFDAQRRKFIGHHAQRPSGRVPSAAVASVGQNFRRSLSFVAGTERTNADSLDLHALAHKIRRAPGAVRGNDDPAASDRVSAKFRQTYLLDSKRSMEDRTRTLWTYSTTSVRADTSGVVQVASGANAPLWRRTAGRVPERDSMARTSKR